MKKSDIVLNSSGINAYLHSKSVENAVKSIADDAAQRLGDGYASDTKAMSGRVVASVYTETVEAMRENYRSNSILKQVLGSVKK